MGLFSIAQMEQINATAQKSKNLAEPQKAVQSRSINSELNEISQKVVEYFKDSHAQLITSKSELHDYVTKMIEAGYGGIDTETTGLDRQKDTIVGVSLYYPGGVECYIPSKHLVPIFDTLYANQLTYEEIGDELQRLVDAKTKLIFANADFDLSMIWKDLKVDLIPVCYYDVILAWRCIKENERHNGLKALYNKYVLKGVGDPMKFSDFFSPALFPYCKPQVAKLYAANDAKITYDLFKWQLPFIMKNHDKCKKRKLESIADLIWGVEFPLIGICQMMHRRGIYLEQSVADMLKRKYLPESEREHEKLRNMVQELMNDPKYSTNVKCPFSGSHEFNPNSTPHVKWLCYDLLKLDGGKKGGTGKEILSTFNLPITKQILKCRSLVTLIGTFVEKLPNSTSDDSRIHCQFKQIGADCVTGDTIIPTKDGYRLIKDICEPAESDEGKLVKIDPIQIYNRYSELEDATHVITYKGYKTLKITTAHGFTIEGTYNHPIIVKKQNNIYSESCDFVELSNLDIGDQVRLPAIFYDGIPDSVDFREHMTLMQKWRSDIRDGSVDIAQYMRSLRNDQLAYYVMGILYDFRYASSILIREKEVASIVHECLAAFGLFTNMIYNQKGMWMLQKYNPDQYYRLYIRNGLLKLHGDGLLDVIYDPIVSIEESVNDVYDLHVPGTHSFISNGIISHNTGRMSSADPNLQNVPSRAKDIRHMFRATPGYVLLSSDYSLRKLAVVKPC